MPDQGEEVWKQQSVPSDVFFLQFRGDKDVYVDWHVVYPIQPKYCQAAGLKEARAALEYEDKKYRKYQSWFANAEKVAELVLVALETFGGYRRTAIILEDIRKAVKNSGVSADSWNTCYLDYSVILGIHIVRSILKTFTYVEGLESKKKGKEEVLPIRAKKISQDQAGRKD
eukprot:TRINITY_DN4057_c0_g1_i1.p2 TRINITY_DN4057_c0_g1~~TRINITY_DN4057_c0_g1_i1.p2  ORF type:complete len:171 (-),score=14.94 TRINITY_DN4057_c0_g1_i1:96-608(-)